MTPYGYEGTIFYDILAREDVWIEGVRAGQAGKFDIVNPYQPGSEFARTWLEGWNYGREFRETPLFQGPPL
jgi:ribosome modulation factor